jgi:predicted secreted protein
MKNAIISGLIIGVLSGLWMFVMHWLGYSPKSGSLTGVEYISVLIPLIVLYFGVRTYRNADCKGHMGFLEALLQSFKILLVGGVITVAAGILYIDEIEGGTNLMDFSGRIFGALLVGILFALGVSVLLTTKPNKVD